MVRVVVGTADKWKTEKSLYQWIRGKRDKWMLLLRWCGGGGGLPCAQWDGGGSFSLSATRDVPIGHN